MENYLPSLINNDQTKVGQQNNNFDEVPIGSNTYKFAIAEFAGDETIQIMATAKNMSLQQKVQSKTVKIRLEGLQQLKKLLENKNSDIQIDIQLSKILKQNNPACLEKALACMQKWMEYGKNWGESQIKQVIQNGYINGKGSPKKLATQIIYRAFQSKAELIQQSIIDNGLKSKTPKIIGGYLALANQLLQQFGIKDMKYLKPYFCHIVKVLNNEKLPIVKTEGMNLLRAALKWLGKDFVWPLISELKQNMRKELQAFWEGYDKKQIIKANRQKNGLNTHINIGVVKQKREQKEDISNQFLPMEGGPDIYQISDPIEIFTKFDEKWSQSVLQAEKWNVKTSMLQQLISKASVPKLMNTEHRHIIQMIRRLLGDNNFNVILTSIKLCGTLAKGLRKNFSHSAKILFQHIISKLRDKKNQMVQQTLNTLNIFYYCLSPQQVGQDIKSALKDKSSGMKNNTIKWMSFILQRKNNLNQNSSDDKLLDFYKNNSFQTIIEGLLNDPAAEVRDSTAKFVCKARNLYGESIFKNIDKCINNKQIINKLNDGDGQQSMSKSRSKDVSRGKSQKSKNKLKSQKDDEELCSKKSYVAKKVNGEQIIDITQQISKHLKKLNDSSNWQNRKQSAQKLIKYLNQFQKEGAHTKVICANLHDFLGILKDRISDPNKQLIKTFVILVGEFFKYLPEKQAKIQGRCFVQQLIEVFADKNESNRKQIYKTLNKICSSLGFQLFIGYLGQILNQQSVNNSSTQINSIVKQYTFQYLLNNEQFLKKVDQLEGHDNLKQLKEYPKIILSGLCDKNKQWRAVSEKMFKIISQKIGIQIFRSNLNSKDIKSAFKSDLTAILDKLESQSLNEQPSMISNGSFLSLTNVREAETSRKRSPSVVSQVAHEKDNGSSTQKLKRKVSNVGSLKSSRSKNKNNSMLICQQNSREYTSNLLFTLKDNESRVEGNELFANITKLMNERVARQQNLNRYRAGSNSNPIVQQQQIQTALSKLVNYEQLYTKMYSNDYRRNLQAVQKLTKACRDVALTSSIRQISDLLLKWATIKLYGGNVPMLTSIELVYSVLAVLEKKKIAWTDFDIEILLHFTKQYLITSFYDGSINNEALKNTFKLAVALSSGERIIKKVLIQMKSDIVQTHRHAAGARREGMNCNGYIKLILSQICCCLIDYFSNDDLLLAAAKIPQLNQNSQFVCLLANKFHQGVLKQFGFNLGIASTNNPQTKINLAKSTVNVQKQDKLNMSRNASPGSAYFGRSQNKNQERNDRRTPQKIINASTIILQSHFPPPSPMSKSQFNHQIMFPLSNTVKQNKRVVNISQIYKNLDMIYCSEKYEIELSKFTQPSQHNPLGSNLQKLYPFNESTVHFFSTLFQPQNQNSEKIVSQLTIHSNIIFGSLFNALIKIMDPVARQSQFPEKILAFLTLVQQSIKCKNIFRHVNEDLISKSMRFTIDQLVYEDENKTNIQNKLRMKGLTQFKSDCFIKGINGIMLRLLDNSNPLLLINCLLLSLIETIIQIKNNEQAKFSIPIINRQKKIGLIIRCFTRVTSSYFGEGVKQKQKEGQIFNIHQDPNCLRQNYINKFILQTKQYLALLDIKNLIDFETNQSAKVINSNSEQSVVSCICTILRALHKKNILTQRFEQIKSQRLNFRDQHILTDFIYYIQGYNTKSTNVLCSNNAYQPQHKTATLQIDQEIKSIIQLLSKAKTFNDGVKDLKVYIQQSGGRFEFKSYFKKMNFQQSFIDKVTEELGNLNKTQIQLQGRSLNPDIQGKLDKLKMKLQGINNEHGSSLSKNHLQKIDKVTTERGNYTENIRGVMEGKTPRARDFSDKSIQQANNQQNDLKKRIEEMKNKVSMSTANRLR